jgi:diguanylate cyclase (GGDEF)-like protein
MDRLIIKIYISLFIVACCIVAFFAITGIGKSPDSMFTKNTQVPVLPVEERYEADDEYLAVLDASEISKAGGCLEFTTVSKDVRICADGNIIYENNGSNSVFLRSNGNVCHFIKVLDEYKTITVELYAVYGGPISAPEFKAGDYYDLRTSLVVSSMASLIISILDIVFGIAIVVYASVIGRFNSKNLKLLPFGVTAILIGIWSSGETNAMIVLLTNRTLASIIAFLILIFIPIPYIEYTHVALWPQDKWRYMIPLCLCIADFFLVTGLAVSGVRDLKNSVIITHITWAFAILYVIVAAVKVLKQKKEERDESAVFNCAAMLILIAVAGLEIIYFWTGQRLENDILGRSLIFGYITVLGYIGIRESAKDIQKGRMAEYYRKLANTDPITGLLSRTAFNHDMEELQKQDEYSIVSIDLNNLKQVNDTKGHLAGDRYILNAANIINKVLGKEGTCYRVGGDEFCAIIKKVGSDAITEKLMKEISEEINFHNTENPDDPVGMAWGYASNTPGQAREHREILHSADEKMYENKRLQKAGAGH